MNKEQIIDKIKLVFFLLLLLGIPILLVIFSEGGGSYGDQYDYLRCC